MNSILYHVTSHVLRGVSVNGLSDDTFAKEIYVYGTDYSWHYDALLNLQCVHAMGIFRMLFGGAAARTGLHE